MESSLIATNDELRNLSEMARQADPQGRHRIELNVRDVSQLFNSMDPSPFHEKDLDHDAEEFIISWAQEHPIQLPIKLVVHLREPPETGDATRLITESVHH